MDIFDVNSKHVLNKSTEGMCLGDHCWIGYGCTIYKNGGLAKNSILAGSSVLTKKIEEENVAVAGNPAKIVKRNINWSSDSVEFFERSLHQGEVDSL